MALSDEDQRSELVAGNRAGNAPASSTTGAGETLTLAGGASGHHPNYQDVTVTCACGHSFETRSTLGEELHIEICSACHPFFTGKQKLVDTAGRVDRFNKRYARGAKATK